MIERVSSPLETRIVSHYWKELSEKVEDSRFSHSRLPEKTEIDASVGAIVIAIVGAIIMVVTQVRVVGKKVICSSRKLRLGGGIRCLRSWGEKREGGHRLYFRRRRGWRTRFAMGVQVNTKLKCLEGVPKSRVSHLTMRWLFHENKPS